MSGSRSMRRSGRRLPIDPAVAGSDGPGRPEVASPGCLRGLHPVTVLRAEVDDDEDLTHGSANGTYGGHGPPKPVGGRHRESTSNAECPLLKGQTLAVTLHIAM